MSDEGEITVRLACAGGKVRGVAVASSRRALPARLVRGRAAADVQRLVPLLYSVCRRAQGAAAAAALAAASGVHVAAADAAQQAREVTLETLQETIWRLLIDWPRAMGEAPLVPPVALVRQSIDGTIGDGVALDALLAVVDAVLQEHVFGGPADAWPGGGLSALDAWIEAEATLPARLLRRLRDESPGLGRSRTPLMPTTSFDSLAAVADALARDPGFARLPCWGGQPAETGALARQAGSALVAAWVARDGQTAAARFVARLVELPQLVDRLRARSDGPQAPVCGHALADGAGLGVAETARGVLLHRAQLEHGAVTDYRIVAPTEWNFHPDGPLAQGLAGRSAADPARLEREARTVVQSLDPCVACRVEIGDA
jgi:hypothetical protein